jgi:hypothetical protein
MPTSASQEWAVSASVIDRFRRVATAPDQERKFPVGPASAKKLGYNPTEVNSLPACLTESFCGVGNLFLMGDPLPGQTLLDLGGQAATSTAGWLTSVHAGGQSSSWIAVSPEEMRLHLWRLRALPLASLSPTMIGRMRTITGRPPRRGDPARSISTTLRDHREG